MHSKADGGGKEAGLENFHENTSMESQECSSANYRILGVQSTLGLALHMYSVYCMAFSACQLAACKVSIGAPDSRPPAN
jgi:hypothetical protein